MYSQSVNAVGPARAGAEAERPASPFGVRPTAPTGQVADPAVESTNPTGWPSADAVAVLGAGHEQTPAPTQAYSRITVDPDTHLVSIAIVNAATDEVIRHVPPEEVIEMARMVQAQLDRRAASAAHAGVATIDHRV